MKNTPPILVLVISLACLFTYWNCLICSFVFDDVSAIKDNKDLRPTTPWSNLFFNDFWGTPMNKEQSHKSYRPICVLTFRLNYFLHGLDPMGYHLVNLFLHVVVCVLFFRLCRLVVGARISLWSSLLFSVHPIHTEAVTGVVGRAELLSSAFYILALLRYVQACQNQSPVKNLVLFATFVTLAMFSKEQGITVLGVAFVYDIFVHQNFNFKSQAAYGQRSLSFLARVLVTFCVGMALLWTRFYVMGSTLPIFTNFDNPASYQEAPVKQMTWSYLIAVNSWLLLSPMDLCCDWTMQTIPLIRSLTDPRNVATLVTFTVMASVGLCGLFNANSKHRHVILFGMSLLVLPFLPASNLFFPVGFVVAERVLYLPSMGFCLLVSYGCDKLSKRFSKKIIISSLLVMTSVHSIRSVSRNFDWKDEFSIFSSGLKVNVANAKLFNNVGHALEAKEDYAKALVYFQQATKVQPDDIGAHINVGRTYNNLQMFSEAEEAYRLAKSLLPQAKPGQKYVARIAPQHLSVFLNLANLVSKNPERLAEADVLYKQAISMRSDYIQAYINRGDILLRMNRTKEAQEVYERALTIEHDNPDLHYNLGVVLIEQAKVQQALAFFDRAIQLDPNHVQALMNSAILIQESGSTELRPLAYKRLSQLMQLTPENDRVYFNLGMLAMDDNDLESAEKWFKKSIELKPDFRSALFNLALLLNERKRQIEAIPFLKSLLNHYPNHIKGLVLLGDIYTNHVKDFEEAEGCYQRIIDIDSNHIQAHHNLCVVLVEKGKLSQARKCLLEVQSRAPNVDYISRHLKIVENRIKQAEMKKNAN